jgi:hypothetical protein
MISALEASRAWQAVMVPTTTFLKKAVPVAKGFLFAHTGYVAAKTWADPKASMSKKVATTLHVVTDGLALISSKLYLGIKLPLYGLAALTQEILTFYDASPAMKARLEAFVGAFGPKQETKGETAAPAKLVPVPAGNGSPLATLTGG